MIVIDLNTLDFSQDVEAVLEGLNDFTPLLMKLATVAENVWNEKFKAEGPGWRRLEDSTLRRRRKGGEEANILRDEGTLFRSLTDAVSEGAVRNITPTSLEIGTNLKYAAVHQFGSTESGVNKHGKPWRHNIPARPFMPEEQELLPLFESAIREHFKQLGWS